jgi:hypothetical protein
MARQSRVMDDHPSEIPIWRAGDAHTPLGRLCTLWPPAEADVQWAVAAVNRLVLVVLTQG